MSGILVQFISHPANRENIVRVLWIGLELLPQTVNVRVDITLITFVFSAPDPIEQIVTRPGTPRLGSQQIQYLKFQRRQVNSGATARNFMPAPVDNQIADFQPILTPISLDAL